MNTLSVTSILTLFLIFSGAGCSTKSSESEGSTDEYEELSSEDEADQTDVPEAVAENEDSATAETAQSNSSTESQAELAPPAESPSQQTEPDDKKIAEVPPEEQAPPPAEPLAAESTPEKTAQNSQEPATEAQATSNSQQVDSPQSGEPLAETTPARKASSRQVAQGETNGGSGPSGLYQVKAGDTLMKIAFENYGDLYQWRKILQLNRDRLKDPTRLEVGQTLNLGVNRRPASIDRKGRPYLIRWGDTLGGISNQVYGTRAHWKKLWDNNRDLIQNPNRIYAGFTLYYLGLSELSGIEKSPTSIEGWAAVQNIR